MKLENSFAHGAEESKAWDAVSTSDSTHLVLVIRKIHCLSYEYMVFAYRSPRSCRAVGLIAYAAHRALLVRCI